MDQNGRTRLLGCLALAVVVLVVLVYGTSRLVTKNATTFSEIIKASEFHNMVENRPEDISSIQISKDWIKGTYSAPKQGFTDFRAPRDPKFPLEELEEMLIANDIEFDYQEPSRLPELPEWLGFFIGGLIRPLCLTGLLLLLVFIYKRGRKRTKELAGASIPEQIEQLTKLKDQGILSEEEFAEKKKELLSKM